MIALALALRLALAPSGAPVQPATAPVELTPDAPIVVQTHIGPDPSSIGDLLELEIIAAFPRGYSVNLPVGVTFAPLHLVDVQEGEPEVTGDALRKTFRVRLQLFATGAAEVPAFALTSVDNDGAVATVPVPATAFTVDALLANEADPQRKPEDPPISIEYPNTLAETIILSALATSLALLVIGLAVRRFLRRKKPIRVEPAIPAHVVALTALAELEKSELLADGRVQDYYLQLTEIAKAYLEGRFGVPALDRTTEEIRSDLQRHAARIEPLTPTEVVDFLQRCDLVKFARFHPEEDESTGALGFVRDAVERSQPRADAPPPPAANEQPPAHSEKGVAS